MKLVEAVNAGLDDLLAQEPRAVILSQLGKYGLGGMTTGLFDKYPDRVLTMPVAENLMNGAAFGMALAGMVPIVIHERMDFLAVGMDPLVNHIPIWQARDPSLKLPIIVIAVVGKGHGQGPQHSKNFAPWFRRLEGWEVREPLSPGAVCQPLAVHRLLDVARMNKPVLYVLHREFFNAEGGFYPRYPEEIGLCGASEWHETRFYNGQK